MVKETVVHVNTIEEWRAVLDVWFEQGYEWFASGRSYEEDNFDNGFGSRQLALVEGGLDYIACYINNDYDGDSLIEFSDFINQQKKDNKMETYYVTPEQLDLIEDLKNDNWALTRLVNSKDIFRPLNNGLEMSEEKAILRYLGGDESIEFKIKEQLYWLWRVNDDGDRVYMKFKYGTPEWTIDADDAFTAPLEEIEKWITPAWSVEEAE